MTLDEYFGDWMKVIDRVGSHVMIWRPFIAKLLKNLSEYDTAIVYVLFGRQAQTFKPYINSRFNHIIEIESTIDISNRVKGIYGVSIKWYEEY